VLHSSNCPTSYDNLSVNVFRDTDATRRLNPTQQDISAATMVMKIRRSQNNRDIDRLCRFLNSLEVDNAPKSMKAVQKNLSRQENLNINWESYKICSKCGQTYPIKCSECTKCKEKKLVEFYLYSIENQLQHLLSTNGVYKSLQNERKKNVEIFSQTTYGQILKETDENSFTMIINADGVVTPNQNISLWPFILMINEVPIPQRRYTENIIIAGVIPAKVKPNNIVFEACLDLITEDLQLIENGQQYYISDLDATDTLHFFTIASCTDKPAEALMENVVVYNAEYGCPKCFTPGEIFHGERGLGNKIKKFHIRVFPYGDIEDRTQDKCTEIVRDMEDEKLSKPRRGHS
ncbi:unnamed protein product, partial [Didymodactylos carnosus]